jgi:cytoskeletal protein CcmA (bactofilin family)
MFSSGKSKSGKLPPIESLIGADLIVEGNLIFKGGLRVDGTIRGNVTAQEGQAAMLVVSDQARIEGEVRCLHVVVNGTIVGPVISTELIELQPKARITGDVTYAALEMHQGAAVDGRLVHSEAAKPALKLAANNA